MSNYLNHLVTRSLNPMETSVQPRLPSLFEPVAGVPALDTVPVSSVEPEGISELEATQLREVTSPRIQTHAENIQSVVRRSPPPPSSEQPPLQPRPTADVHELGFVPPIQSLSEPLPVAPQSPIPQRDDRYQPAPLPKAAKAVDSASEEPTIPQQTVIQRVVEQLFPSQSDDVGSSKVPPPAPMRREDKSASSAPNLPPPNELPMPTLMPVRHYPTEIVKPQITPLIQPLQTPAVVSQEASQPTPTIQVTIGRIEVRATPAPVPTSTQAQPKPPVMSLEEYLHRRGGRR